MLFFFNQESMYDGYDDGDDEMIKREVFPLPLQVCVSILHLGIRFGRKIHCFGKET